MGGFGYDRQVFVKSKESSPPPSRSPLPGALVLILVAALGAFAAYRYIKAGGLSNVDSDSNNAQVKQLQHKIQVLQARIDELEKSRRLSRPQSPTEGARQEVAKAKPPEKLSAELTHRPKLPIAEAPVQKSLNPPSAKPTTSPAPSQAKPDPSMNLMQGDLEASHQEWEAAVNRLGKVVGELDEQRTQVKKNQNDVNQLLSITRRTGIPFGLKKGARFQRVGPISIKLASTDVSNQRYTLRLVVDDKSVELKDRALNEVVQFYTARSQFPVNLVVSQIKKGQVSGMLSVPSDLNATDQNAQMQPR